MKQVVQKSLRANTSFRPSPARLWIMNHRPLQVELNASSKSRQGLPLRWRFGIMAFIRHRSWYHTIILESQPYHVDRPVFLSRLPVLDHWFPKWAWRKEYLKRQFHVAHCKEALHICQSRKCGGKRKASGPGLWCVTSHDGGGSHSCLFEPYTEPYTYLVVLHKLRARGIRWATICLWCLRLSCYSWQRVRRPYTTGA